MSNLLIIDSETPSIDKFINGINENTMYVTYHINDTFEMLNEKINNLNSQTFDNVAFVFTNSGSPLKMFVNHNSFVSFDNTGVQPNNTTNFIKDLFNKFQIKKLDFLACDLLQESKWKDYFDLLMNENQGLIVRASNDKTGNLSAGGDWILESTNEDVHDLYFNDSIANWNHLLDVSGVGTVIGDDGILYTCGYAPYGGLGRTNGSFSMLTGLTDISSVICGYLKTFVIKSNGQVWARGNNGNGQLGMGGDTTVSTSFKQLITSTSTPITNIIAIASCNTHTALIKSDNTLWVTGSNSYGQLGNNGNTQQTYFVQATTAEGFITDAISVSCGQYHTVVVRSNGTVWTTGYNYFGQLGNGTNVNSNIFVQAKDLSNNFITDASYVSCGYTHTMIIRGANNEVWGCGDNASGNLGIGTKTSSEMLFKPCKSSQGFITNCSKLTCGNGTSFILIGNSLFATGYNGMGALGFNNFVDLSLFTQVVDSSGNNLNDIISISALSHNTSIVKSDGSVWATGYNDKNQLGINSYTSKIGIFSKCKNNDGSYVSGAVNVGTSDGHIAILKNDGTVWACGGNIDSTLYTFSKAQTETGFMSDVANVWTSANTTAVVRNDGTLWMCGYDRGGFGTINNTYPVFIQAKETASTYITGVSLVKGMQGGMLVLKNDGTVWGSGQDYGLFANGVTGQQKYFVPLNINNVKTFDCVDFHVILVKNDGSVWGAGTNYLGHLGTGTTDTVTGFIQLTKSDGSFFTNVRSASVGNNHTAIVLEDNTLWMTGHNTSKQIDSTGVNYLRFTQAAITDVKVVSCGQMHTCVLKNDGTLWTCGNNTNKELGAGYSSHVNNFYKASYGSNQFLSNVLSVRSVTNTNYVVTQDKSLWVCGTNGGMFGNGAIVANGGDYYVKIASLLARPSVSLTVTPNSNIAISSLVPGGTPITYTTADQALAGFISDSWSVTNYVNLAAGSNDIIFENVKSAVKSNLAIDADITTAKKQLIAAILSKNANPVLNLTSSTNLLAAVNTKQANLSTKPVKVLLPTIPTSGTTGTINMTGVTTSASSYTHFEMPVNYTITLSNVTPSVTLKYTGTGVTIVNGGVSSNKVLGDNLTIGTKTYKIVALGSITLDEVYTTVTQAITALSTDTTAVTKYITSATGTANSIFETVKSAVKTNLTTDADITSAKTQMIASLITKNGSSVVNLTGSTNLLGAVNTKLAGLSTKPVQVLLPTISGSTGTFSMSGVTTNSTTYTHIEMPKNTTISLSDVSPAVSLTYTGTGITYVNNGVSSTKNLGDALTIGAKTYKIVALGSVTLDETTGGAGGDPHIRTFNGEVYDLPNVKGKFLLFDNRKVNKLKVICYCDFLNEYEIANSGRFAKLIKDSTFIKQVSIITNDFKLSIDMNTLQIKYDNLPQNINVGNIYEDKYVFEQNYNNLKKYVHKINFDGKSRNIYVNFGNESYKIKLSVDLNCADHRTEVQIEGPDLNSGFGALVSSKHYSKLV